MNVKTLSTLALCASLTACGTVDTGNRGVFTRYGQVIGEPVAEGLHWYNPMTTDLNEMSIRTLKWDSNTEAYTRDFQQASIQFTLSYSLDPRAVKRIFVTVGEGWNEALVPQVVVQEIKNVTGISTAIGLIEKRSIAQSLMMNAIAVKLRKRGVIVSGFELRDISYSKAFEDAVEQKQVAVERANAAKNRTVQVQEEATQRVLAAKADAEAMQIKSAALSANPGLAQYEAVQKWDGVLPVTMYGGAAVPFIPIK